MMNTKRNDMLRMVLDIFDTIEQLRHENMLLREITKRVDSEPSGPELNAIDMLVIETGRREVLKRYCAYWRPTVRITIDEDTDEITGVTDYEKWVKSYVEKVPDDCSRKSFCEYFDAEIRAVYEEEREKALAAVHNDGA